MDIETVASDPQQFSDKNQTITPISIETENHTKFYDRLLSISDIC